MRRAPATRVSCESALERHLEARSDRFAAGVGLGVGAIASVVGFALAARGAEIRGMESSADTESGLGLLLGGTLLGGAGVMVAVGSGIGFGAYSARSRDAKTEVQRACRRSPSWYE